MIGPTCAQNLTTMSGDVAEVHSCHALKHCEYADTIKTASATLVGVDVAATLCQVRLLSGLSSSSLISLLCVTAMMTAAESHVFISLCLAVVLAIGLFEL